MPKVVITHAVQDIDRWLQGKTERAAAIESGTGSNVTDYVAQDGSNNIAITADVADVERLKGMLASPPPEVLEKMLAEQKENPDKDDSGTGKQWGAWRYQGDRKDCFFLVGRTMELAAALNATLAEERRRTVPQ